MSDFIEAIVIMLPPEAGGRATPIAPREGNYRPFARESEGPLLRVRFIEGPPTLAPGESARVVMEVDDNAYFIAGAELDLLEAESDKTGVITVARVLR